MDEWNPPLTIEVAGAPMAEPESHFPQEPFASSELATPRGAGIDALAIGGGKCVEPCR